MRFGPEFSGLSRLALTQIRYFISGANPYLAKPKLFKTVASEVDAMVPT
jgi:hypothetical protein